MGEIVGAALVAHVPTIMLPKEWRIEHNEGKEITLVPGLQRMKAECLDRLKPDTVLVFDTHWESTWEHLVTGHDRRQGKFTSSELPRGMRQIDEATDLRPMRLIGGHLGSCEGDRLFEPRGRVDAALDRHEAGFRLRFCPRNGRDGRRCQSINHGIDMGADTLVPSRGSTDPNESGERGHLDRRISRGVAGLGAPCEVGLGARLVTLDLLSSGAVEERCRV